MSTTAPMWRINGTDDKGAASAQFIALDGQLTSLTIETDDGSMIGVVLAKQDIQALRQALTMRLIEMAP